MVKKVVNSSSIIKKDAIGFSLACFNSVVGANDDIVIIRDS